MADVPAECAVAELGKRKPLDFLPRVLIAISCLYSKKERRNTIINFVLSKVSGIHLVFFYDWIFSQFVKWQFILFRVCKKKYDFFVSMNKLATENLLLPPLIYRKFEEYSQFSELMLAPPYLEPILWRVQ